MKPACPVELSSAHLPKVGFNRACPVEFLPSENHVNERRSLFHRGCSAHLPKVGFNRACPVELSFAHLPKVGFIRGLTGMKSFYPVKCLSDCYEGWAWVNPISLGRSIFHRGKAHFSGALPLFHRGAANLTGVYQYFSKKEKQFYRKRKR